MKKRFLTILILISLLYGITGNAIAQTYYFEIPQATINAFWNEDGTLSLDYVWVFENDSSDPIEYIDLGLPNSNFEASSIYADINGSSISDISRSGFQSSEPGGVGVALGLGKNSIPYQQSGTAHAYVGTVKKVIYPDDKDKNYVSAVFAPAWFDRSVVHGTTDITVIFHLPPGVQPDEPRWHKAPAGFSAEPATGFDAENRITYTWRNPNANSHTEYDFGASFPKQYIPENAIVKKSFFTDLIAGIGIFLGSLSQCCVPILFISFFVGTIGLSMYSDRKRRKQYLPPKISIEGHGVKRGLTAVEAAVIMEQPVDTVLTMILFALIKKNAAEVVTRKPLEIKAMTPLPDDLRPYEKEFVEAFDEKGATRRRAMQKTMINLIKSVTEKMKGFSRKETIAYYKSIMNKAWKQVEEAQTPQVKSEKFDEVMEWTMLDRDFNDRTREIFQHQPVYVPTWWMRFDPGYESRSPRTVPTSGSRPAAGPLTATPRVPGSDFAASIVTGIEGFAGNMIGNVTDFTNRITSVTNPRPKSSSSGSGRYRGGGGSSCACACACAGCACACAGGGR